MQKKGKKNDVKKNYWNCQHEALTCRLLVDFPILWAHCLNVFFLQEPTDVMKKNDKNDQWPIEHNAKFTNTYQNLDQNSSSCHPNVKRIVSPRNSAQTSLRGRVIIWLMGGRSPLQIGSGAYSWDVLWNKKVKYVYISQHKAGQSLQTEKVKGLGKDPGGWSTRVNTLVLFFLNVLIIYGGSSWWLLSTQYVDPQLDHCYYDLTTPFCLLQSTSGIEVHDSPEAFEKRSLLDFVQVELHGSQRKKKSLLDFIARPEYICCTLWIQLENWAVPTAQSWTRKILKILPHCCAPWIFFKINTVLSLT